MWRPKGFYFRQLLKLLGMIISSVAIGHILFIRAGLGALETAITVVGLFATMIFIDCIIAFIIRTMQKNKQTQEQMLDKLDRNYNQKSQNLEKTQLEQQNYISQLHQKVQNIESLITHIEQNLLDKQKKQQENEQNKFVGEIENIMSQINSNQLNDDNNKNIANQKYDEQKTNQYYNPFLHENNEKDNQNITNDVYQAIIQQKIGIALQSIIAAKYQKIIGYQAFAYVKNDKQISRLEMQKILQQNSLNAKLDLQSIKQIFSIAASFNNNPLPIIYSPSVEIFNNPQEFQELVKIFEDYQNIAANLYLQWKQQDYQFTNPAVKDALRVAANYGVRYALTDIVNLDIDFAELARQNFKIVSINANDLLYNTHRMGAQFHPEDYHDLMRRNDIMMVTDQVNEPEMISHLLGKNVEFVQGEAVAEAQEYQDIAASMTG